VEETFETELDRLEALQNIDREIKEREDHAAVLRGEVEQIDADLRGRHEAVAQLGTEHVELEKQRNDLDERIKAEEQKIKGSRMRMTRIRKETELLALQHEINMAQETTAQLEEQLLAVMVRIDEVAANLAAARAALDEGEKPSAGAAVSRRAALEEIEREVAVQRKRRDVVMQGMDEDLRAKYEQILSRRGGMAVVEVRNGTCQGCHMHVPPQLFNEIQKFREVRQCPNCRRILFWRPEAETG
jgi:uncharacterized protein